MTKQLKSKQIQKKKHKKLKKSPIFFHLTDLKTKHNTEWKENKEK